MKIFKILLISVAFVLGVVSCDLTEHPTFLSEESAYEGLSNIRASLDGIYNGYTQYSYYSNDFIYASFVGSGFFISGIGNSNTHPNNKYLASLMPLNTQTYTENPWKGMYKTVERANVFIANVEEIETPVSSEDLAINDALGEAYFLRALTYFNLVQMYGSIPLRLEPSTSDNIHMAKSATDIIYQQIIDDAKNAERLMYSHPLNRPGYPASEAVSMLLAKIYMTMATTDDPVPMSDAQQCWTLAYESAKKVYGKYNLNSSYAEMFEEATSDNTAESIFEIQFNDLVHNNHSRLFTAGGAVKAATWGRIRANAELYDLHKHCYPDDTTRLNQTFKTQYVKFKTGKLIKLYPIVQRNWFNNSFPYIYKHWQKNRMATTPYYQKNFIVYRYADLLLMLAEISNELDNGEQFDYVNEVLNRVGLSTDDFVPDSITGADYNGGKEAFRKAIMLEYRFELLAEGQDYFNNRRRGFDFFKDMVIEPHNNYENFKPNIDVTLSSDKNLVMHFPIPQSEINTNNLIDN